MKKHKYIPSELLKIGTVGSNSRKAEIEFIVNNVLKILKRTGDTMRELTKEEYIEERKKDSNGQNISSNEEFWLDEFLNNWSPLNAGFHPNW